MMLFLCGDVMTGRGIDQILCRPSDPVIFEPFVRDAREYVALAESRNGPIDAPVSADYIWGDARAEFDRVRPDVRIANLETAVTAHDQHWRGKGINYRMHPANVDCLAAGRLNVCALANNHVLDYGYEGLVETLDALTRAGLRTSGAGRNLSEAQLPAIVSPTSDRRVLVFGAATTSSGVPPAWAARDDRAGIDLLPDLSDRTADAMLDRVHRWTQAHDIVVASIHWGPNWGYDIAPDEAGFAHRLVDGGVHIVHGHSSHHPRPIEVYRNRLILYGCGDFIDDYEGIAGHEQFRGDLVVMYFARLADTGALIDLQATPMQLRKMQLRRPSAADTAWMGRSLAAMNRPYEVAVDTTSAGTFVLRWRDQTGHGAH